MRVLVACEYSGTVRDAFLKRGHDAMSCDLLSTDVPGPHYQGDVFDLITGGGPWDLMIAHPPCTHLAGSGAAHWAAKRADGRQQEAIDFVKRLHDCGIPKIAIENPVGILTKAWRPPDQYVQPHFFGEPYVKKTGLWLKGLPKLIATNNVEPTHYWVSSGSNYRENKNGKKKLLNDSAVRNWKERSKTFQGIADAMADQWG